MTNKMQRKLEDYLFVDCTREKECLPTKLVKSGKINQELGLDKASCFGKTTDL